MCRGPPPPPPPHTYTHTHPAEKFRAGAKLYGSRSISETFCQFCPPPQANTLAPPLPYPIMVIIPPPPPRWLSFSGLAQCSARHFARIVEVLLASLPWGGVVYGNGSGVAGCSWWGDTGGDSTMLWDRVGLNVVGWGWGKRWDTSYTAQTHIHRN